MKKTLPLVSIITVNYNGKQFLNDCFKSLLNLNYPKNKLEIFMVDNGSVDGSLDCVRKNFPTVKVIINSENNYTKANNLGIKAAKGDYTALINNDVKVDKNWLKELLYVIGTNPKIGCVCSKVLFPDGRIQSTGHYEFPNFYWSDRGFKEDNKGQYNEIEEVSSISHCSALYRGKCFDDVGLLDEDFNMYVEDVDMSIRAKQKGWRLFYVPKSIVYHKFHGSADDDLANFYCERNRLLLIVKHHPEKLADALFGQGYFTVLKNKNELLKILPLLFTKLLKHHGIETINPLLPDIFKSLNTILNMEKDCLIKQIDTLRLFLQEKDSQIFNLNDKISQDLSLLSQKDQFLQQRDSQILNLNDKISQDFSIISQKEHELFQKDQLLQQRDSQILNLNDKISQDFSIISQKERLVQDKDKEISALKEKIGQDADSISRKDQDFFILKEKMNQIYNSETYRFIVLPIWRILNIAKRIKIKRRKFRQKYILIIKPTCFGIEETEGALRYFRESNLNAVISLIANLFEEDYAQIINNQDIDEKIIYNQQYNKLTGVALFKLLVKLRKKKIDEAIVLIGNPVYQGYRKAKLLASLSGARKVKLYFFNSTIIAPSNSFTFFWVIWKSLYSNVLLFAVLILFFTFIVIPLRVRKLFNK